MKMKGEKDNKRTDKSMDVRRDGASYIANNYNSGELCHKDASSATKMNKDAENDILQANQQFKGIRKPSCISEKIAKNIDSKSASLNNKLMLHTSSYGHGLHTPTVERRESFEPFKHAYSVINKIDYHSSRNKVYCENVLCSTCVKEQSEANYYTPRVFLKDYTLKEAMNSSALDHSNATLKDNLNTTDLYTSDDASHQPGSTFTNKSNPQEYFSEVEKVCEDQTSVHPDFFGDMKSEKGQVHYRLEKKSPLSIESVTSHSYVDFRGKKGPVNISEIGGDDNIKDMHREMSVESNTLGKLRKNEEKAHNKIHNDKLALQENKTKKHHIRLKKSHTPEKEGVQSKDIEKEIAEGGHLESKDDSHQFNVYSYKYPVDKEDKGFNIDKMGSEIGSHQDTMHCDSKQTQEMNELDGTEKSLFENKDLSESANLGKDTLENVNESESTAIETSYPEGSEFNEPEFNSNEDSLANYEIDIKCMSPQEYEGLLGIIKMKRIFRDQLYNRKGYKYKSEFQVRVLNDILKITPYPNAEVLDAIGVLLNLKPRSVQIWFQNARQAGEAQVNREQLKELRKTSNIDTRQIFDIYLRNRSSKD
ncbi:uncharacterized protein VICG_00761 [Vittaforma corneae ATCC 50505]|uniref:Homeobox domain-containing protein n=1 Tax=Vittaforma corneae (strain ATCC 50505) TaxID=993615 RepID=L2GNR5_VITCO|nr:uncharacterized protein VICG_00761 [Vittaforma corneae ATCC 50505]ELA42120.1 hypothetical protein VICG_00761 [Vittaforma corneae ATCC 50505]